MSENKTALIYGGGGAIGGAVARAFAGAGARVYLAGRTGARFKKVANDIGGAAGAPLPSTPTLWRRTQAASTSR